MGPREPVSHQENLGLAAFGGHSDFRWAHDVDFCGVTEFSHLWLRFGGRGARSARATALLARPSKACSKGDSGMCKNKNSCHEIEGRHLKILES